RLSLLALVIAMGFPNSSPAHRLQRGDEHLSARDRIADARGTRESLLLGLGWPIGDEYLVPGRLVREQRRESLLQRKHLLRDQARCWRRHRRTAFLHAILLHGV